MANGKLVINAKKQIRVKFTNSKGKEVEMAVPEAELSPSLKREPVEKLNGRDVELDEEKGQPRRVRPVGEAFAAAAPTPKPASSAGGSGKERGSSPQPRQQHGQRPAPQPQRQAAHARRPPAFHNPYNFIPALPREGISGDLADAAPAGHHRYHIDRYSGVIKVKLTVATPLLLLDGANASADANEHRSFPVRLGPDGRPYIPPTSIKGMLRAAYEAVTNSRMAVFAGHDHYLTYRTWNPRTRSAPKVNHPLTPLDLLPASLRPAESFHQLSPADRVFGWVSQRGQGAYQGNVRIGPVTCESPDAIENFGEPGLPLAILGQPKEQQARFYVATTPNGEAQADGLSKEEAGYRIGKGLRGRKVYPHHGSLPEGHWTDPMTDRTQQANSGHFREYPRPRLNGQEQRDNQNRSIHGWVKPETTFAFDLHVTNLSKVELGALLWLLSLPAEHYHRLGGGKPLGFGSVRLDIDDRNTHLHDGNGWRAFYSTLDPCTPPEVDREAAINSYKEAMIAAYGPNPAFDEVSFMKAFLRMAKGFKDNLPLHYPRARQQGQTDPVPPHPEGLAYQWFVANDRTGRDAGPQVSLPDLATDSGMPMLDAPHQGG